MMAGLLGRFPSIGILFAPRSTLRALVARGQDSNALFGMLLCEAAFIYPRSIVNAFGRVFESPVAVLSGLAGVLLHHMLVPVVAVRRSPVLRRIARDADQRAALLTRARVLVCGRKGYAFVDVEAPRIVISTHYYATGTDLDLYLDLVHELTHLRQLGQGFDLWDDRLDHVERPTEVEAYAVAVEEGRRLGMSEKDVLEHLKNPWMTKADVRQLLAHIDTFIAGGPLPNIESALADAPFVVRHPWRCPRPTPAADVKQARGKRRRTS